ncbi:class I SAM-dependent methyltransferase [Streptomyces sp. ASQP_92]|uniref:class I SAM-dependent methyltransferase n=1 Tax=Streptomyces sp. ASQP_92 TaxID=2979116 RepID=UPI0021BFA102|nr:class I SAM-dependent methyltransferase [Streptomyces sp. ASQP_92]MCT9092543.1 class I SAM-dependent methyltransferase [Streptomyces sp. ASQP_92]
MSDAQQQYDQIGEAFEGFKTLPLIQYGEVPAFLAMVGDVTGKSVIDLGGGTGFYARELKRRGASDVFCIDVSGEMIAVGEKIEESAPLGVRYAVGDVAGMGEVGTFDVGVAVQLFNYAEDVAAVEKLCRVVRANLAEGAEFFVFTMNPSYRFDGPPLDKYGFRCEATGETSPIGIPSKITALLGDHPVSFTAIPPSRETLESCLSAAGFTGIEWVPMEISPAGIEKYGREFWDDFYGNPPLTMLRCRA